jgi:hypothetical protein
MYSKKSWGGAVDPHILVKFLKPNEDAGDPKLGIVIWEWKDYDYIWKPEEGEDVCWIEVITGMQSANIYIITEILPLR